MPCSNVLPFSFRQTHHKPLGPLPTHPTHPTNQPSTPVQNEALRVDEKSLHASAMLVKEKIPYAPPTPTRTCCGGGCPLSVVVVFFVEKNRTKQKFLGFWGWVKGTCGEKNSNTHPTLEGLNLQWHRGSSLFPRSKKGARIQCRSPYITLNMSHYIYGTVHSTVDGQNPAPPRMMIIPLFIGF